MSRRVRYISISMIVLLIIAIGSYFIAIRIDAKLQENKLVNQYLKNQEAYRTLSVKPNANDASDGNSDLAETNELVGVLRIPSIGVKAPVVEGSTPNNLKYAVAHFSNSATPGQAGNTAFAANDRFSLSIFKNLENIEMGSMIDLSYKGKNYQYKVCAKEKESNSTSFLTAIKQTKQSIITLIEYSDGIKQILQVQANLV